MAILYRKIKRTLNVINKTNNTVSQIEKVYPVITYKYTESAKLKEVAQEISSMSGVTEGNAYSVLKDFRTYLKKALLSGRTVNIEGLGYFYLSAKSGGTDTFDEFDSTDISALRICFQANNDIRISTKATTRTEGLVLKDVDKINRSELSVTEPDTTPDETETGGGEQSQDPNSLDPSTPFTATSSCSSASLVAA